MPSPRNLSHSLIMTPTSEQVDAISELLAVVLEDIIEELPQEGENPTLEGEEHVGEEALARAFAKSLAATGGDGQLKGLLGAARGMLGGSLEVF